MKTNYHTHTTWCDGKDTPRKVIQAAVAKGFEAIGFSSHAMLPLEKAEWGMDADVLPRYAREVRRLADEFKDQILVLCGVEADYVPGRSNPDRATYAAIAPNYIIGSVHFVVAPTARSFRWTVLRKTCRRESAIISAAMRSGMCAPTSPRCARW